MDRIIATLTIAFLVILPLIRFYQRNNWGKKANLINLIFLLLIWSITYAAFHELCHLFGTYIVGGTITNYQLIPKYWKGDFRTAYVNPEYKTGFQEFVIRTIPYFRDLLFGIIGFLILKQQKIKNSFIVGLILIIFIFSSLFDVVTNFLGFAIDEDGDFNGLVKLIGRFWTYLIALFISSIIVWTTYRVFQIYHDFPKKSN